MLSFPAAHPLALRRRNRVKLQSPAHLPDRSRVPPRRSPSRKFWQTREGSGSQQAEFLRQTRRGGAEATLFVESAEGGRSSDSRHLSLSVLSEMGVSLECAYEDA